MKVEVELLDMTCCSMFYERTRFLLSDSMSHLEGHTVNKTFNWTT